MANHALPSTASTYSNYTSEIQGRIDDVCKGLDTSGTYTSLPTNSIGWNSTSAKWQKWSGTAWGDLVATSASYSININGTIGVSGATPAAGTFTTLVVNGPTAASGAGLTALFASPPNIGGTAACASGRFTSLQVDTGCTLPAAATVTAGGTIVGTTATQSLTNKTLTTPTISGGIISNTFTLTLPTTAATTLVGTDTTDTLTNKTLTSPKIGTSILDTAGATLVGITATASATNYLTINNTINGGIITLAATGAGANCGINLTSQGTGTVTVNGTALVDYTSAQTLTNKNITGTFTGNITGNVTGNCSGSSGSCTGAAATASALTTTANYQMNSIGVGVAPAGTAGDIKATGNITAYATSDKRFKTNIVPIENALDKVVAIGCKEFDWTEEYLVSHGGVDDYFNVKQDFGVIAQDVQKVFPKAVRTKPDGTLAVDYTKLSILAFAAISELAKRIEILERT